MTYTLTRLPDAPFIGRDGLAAVAGRFGGSVEELLVYGGWTQNDPINAPRFSMNDIWLARDLKRGDWQLIRKHAQWSERHNFHALTSFANSVHIIGSDTQQGIYTDDHWVSGNRRDFRLVEEECPWGPRVLSMGCRFGDWLLVMGGQTAPWAAGPTTSRDPIYYSDIWGCVWDSSGVAPWVKLADNLPCFPRGMIDKAVVHDGAIYLIGGGCYEPRTVTSEVWRIDYKVPEPEQDEEQDGEQDGESGEGDGQGEPPPPPPKPDPDPEPEPKQFIATLVSEGQFAPRGYHNVESWDGKLWIIGGYSPEAGNMGDILYSEDGGVTWIDSGLSVPPRHAAALVVYQDKLTLIAGNGQPMRRDVWQIERAAAIS